MNNHSSSQNGGLNWLDIATEYSKFDGIISLLGIKKPRKGESNNFL